MKVFAVSLVSLSTPPPYCYQSAFSFARPVQLGQLVSKCTFWKWFSPILKELAIEGLGSEPVLENGAFSKRNNQCGQPVRVNGKRSPRLAILSCTHSIVYWVLST